MKNGILIFSRVKPKTLSPSPGLRAGQAGGTEWMSARGVVRPLVANEQPARCHAEGTLLPPEEEN